jgi:hypothetical protein
MNERSSPERLCAMQLNLKIGFRRKLAAQISRLTSTHTTSSCAGGQDKALPQELYESIALGNALAEIEDDASRKWR